MLKLNHIQNQKLNLLLIPILKCKEYCIINITYRYKALHRLLICVKSRFPHLHLHLLILCFFLFQAHFSMWPALFNVVKLMLLACFNTSLVCCQLVLAHFSKLLTCQHANMFFLECLSMLLAYFSTLPACFDMFYHITSMQLPCFTMFMVHYRFLHTVSKIQYIASMFQSNARMI